MLITENNFIRCHTFSFSHLNSNRNGSKRYPSHTTLAKKKDFSEIPNPENKTIFPLKLARKKILVLQSSAIGVFALGFIDAGYSGDWARIGAISRGTEDILKAAAFLVVPLCIFLIFSLSKNIEE